MAVSAHHRARETSGFSEGPGLAAYPPRTGLIAVAFLQGATGAGHGKGFQQRPKLRVSDGTVHDVVEQPWGDQVLGRHAGIVHQGHAAGTETIAVKNLQSGGYCVLVCSRHSFMQGNLAPHGFRRHVVALLHQLPKTFLQGVGVDEGQRRFLGGGGLPQAAFLRA